MFTSAGAFSFLRYASLLLILLTVGLLTWHRYGMNTVYDVGPNSGFVYEPHDDRFQGGKSVATLQRVGDKVIFDCELDKTYQWPYCETEIYLKKMPDGVDLTGYDSISFDMQYSGPEPHTVRFYLRNFEPDISKVGVLESLKVNEAEFNVPESGEIDVPIKLFRIASWWAVNMKAPLLSTDMRIDRVSLVQISTGSFVEAGHHRITIKAIRFHGKWISQIQLVMALTGAWFMFGIIWLIMALQYFRTSFIASRRREAQLQSINQALELETKELAGQARTDSLTGALNREGLRDFLMHQWMGRIPTEPPLSVIFVDIDHFKLINDEHGHAVGDKVLCELAHVIQGEIRSQDRFVRWGGEEFLILCQDTRDYQGRGLAEKLRGSLARHTWPDRLAVTASFGVTMHLPDEEFGDMLLRADRALYQAKDNGRNRVEVA